MGFGTLIIIFVLLAFAVAIGSIIMQERMKKQMRNTILNISNFTPTYEYMSENGTTGIAIDEKRKQICLVKNNEDKKIIPYRDLLSVEILQDGTSVTRTSRTSQAASALIGGLLLGGVGAVVGALTGSSVSRTKISRVDMKLTINDTREPIFMINFQNTKGKQGGIIHSATMKKANEWAGRLAVVIKIADMDDLGSGEAQEKIEEKFSIASELEKLHQLKIQGVLSEVEFVQQKKKLLMNQK